MEIKETPSATTLGVVHDATTSCIHKYKRRSTRITQNERNFNQYDFIGKFSSGQVG